MIPPNGYKSHTENLCPRMQDMRVPTGLLGRRILIVKRASKECEPILELKHFRVLAIVWAYFGLLATMPEAKARG